MGEKKDSCAASSMLAAASATGAAPQSRQARSRASEQNADPEDTNWSARRAAVELSLLFILALSLRAVFNFSLPHVNNFASCDAFEYINNGQALVQIFAQPLSFWQKSLLCLTSNANAADLEQVRSALSPLKDFYISGPVFPAFLALLVALSGVTATASNVHHLWPALLAGNSLVSALSCVFIALIANEAFGKRSARIAGVLAAFYPAFIVNSGRLYSETFATFLLVALSYITLVGFRNGGSGFALTFASGFLAAALQLTRSVMAVLSLALLPITAMQQKGLKRIAFLLPFALGFLLVALPWLGFQKLAFGGGGLVVDRVGHYNFFIGNNVETQGWLSYPYPDGRNVDSTGFPQLMQSAIKKSPARWFRLMLDKPLRLFEFPWNDFRTAIGAWDFKGQVLFHELIVLLSALGLGLSLLLSVNGAPSRRELYCRVYLAGLLAFHFIYCLFITVPRYNLTAMPEFIVFAAAGIALIMDLIDKRRLRAAALVAGAFGLLFVLTNNNLMPFLVPLAPAATALILQALIRSGALLAALAAVISLARSMHGYRRSAIALASLLALAALPLVLIPLRANGRYLEWYQNISVSTPPLRQLLKLPLSACSRNPGGLYLLVDSAGVRQPADGLDLMVNGQRLAGPILPSMAFAENFDRFLELGPKTVQREGERMWDSLANSAGCGNLDLRQWSMIPLPEAVVRAAVARAQNQRSASVALEVSVKNLSEQALRIYGSYDVNDRERVIPSLDVYSWEKVFYGVENSEGLSDTRYDIKVPASTLLGTRQDLSDLPGLQNGVLNMAVLVSPPVVERNAVPFVRLTGTAVPVNERAAHGTAPTDGVHGNASRDVVHGNAPADGMHGTPAGDHFCGMKLLASRELGALTVNKNTNGRLPVNLQGLPAGCDSIWVLRLHGRSRVRLGNACPYAEVDTEYLGRKAGTYTCRSAWSPKRLTSSREWKDFEFVIPVKPLVEDATAEVAFANLGLAPPDSPYLNLQRPLNGEVEFAGLALDVYLLPSNPIGLGHQVY